MPTVVVCLLSALWPVCSETVQAHLADQGELAVSPLLDALGGAGVVDLDALLQVLVPKELPALLVKPSQGQRLQPTASCENTEPHMTKRDGCMMAAPTGRLHTVPEHALEKAAGSEH